MSTISVSLPSDGSAATVSQYNTPLTTITNAINGGLDNTNIASAAAIATSKLADDAGITTAKLSNASVTANKLATGGAAAFVTTAESTATQTYTDLTTTTDTVTVTIGANGLALVTISADLLNNGVNGVTFMGFAVSGATTVAANDNQSISFQAYANNAHSTLGAPFLVTGLAAGSTTFKAKYRASANTGTWTYRRIGVIPL